MSAIASFRLMPKDKFDEYCRMARLLPKGGIKRQGYFVAEMVTEEMQKSPKYQKLEQHYKMLWKYLQKNSKEPYDYNWSGYVIYDLMCCLKEMKKIDLMEKALEDEDGEEDWVFDRALKEKYIRQLDPSNFTEKELKYWNGHIQRERFDAMVKAAGPKLSKEQMKMEMEVYKVSDFPEAGKAMMDGIVIIHNCLKLVDDKTVILLRIG